jgi:hypothetical protein
MAYGCHIGWEWAQASLDYMNFLFGQVAIGKEKIILAQLCHMVVLD